MASPILDLLEGRARGALPFIQQGVSLGLSASAIIGNLNPLGLTFRRTDMLSVIRHVQSAAILGVDVFSATQGFLQQATKPPSFGPKYVSSVRNQFLPDITRLEKSVTFTKGRYSYLVKITGSDIYTGQAGVQYVSVATDTLLTKQEALDTAAGLIEDTANSGSITYDAASVVNITVNPLFA